MDLKLTNLDRPAGPPAYALQGSTYVHPASSEVTHPLQLSLECYTQALTLACHYHFTN